MNQPSTILTILHTASTLLFLVLLVASVRRIVFLRRELTAQRRQTCHDPLTGSANRVGLDQAWNERIIDDPTVAVLDLDGFKPVNDQHGHQAGDQVLRVVARRLRLPGVESARLGGDEFALILPTASAHTIARHLGQRIAQPIPLPSGVFVRVTASIGLSNRGSELAELLAEADAAMYRAKTSQAGVAVYDPVLDDRTSPQVDPRPAVRVRDLSPISVVEVAA